jgi:quinol monooxygenase YgiN
MSASHVSWMFELAVREGREGDLRPLMAEMAQATERNEAHTLEYEWYLSEDGRRLHLWERYVDEAAALAHLRTFEERFAKRFFAILKPERITLYGASVEAVRSAMGELRPPIMTRAAGFSRHASPGAA